MSVSAAARSQRLNVVFYSLCQYLVKNTVLGLALKNYLIHETFFLSWVGLIHYGNPPTSTVMESLLHQTSGDLWKIFKQILNCSVFWIELLLGAKLTSVSDRLVQGHLPLSSPLGLLQVMTQIKLSIPSLFAPAHNLKFAITLRSAKTSPKWQFVW